MCLFLSGYDPTQEHSGAALESSIPVDHGDEESNSTSEETASDDTIDQSGHIHPAEMPTAEVITVTDDSDSSVNAPILNNYPVTLLTSSVSVTLSPSSGEFESSSPEVSTFIHESNASSGAEPLEDIQGKLEQEGLGENPEISLSKTQNITDNDLEERERGSDQTSESGEGSGEPLGQNPERKSELLLTNPTLSTNHTSEGLDGETGTGAPSPEVKVTLIPHLTLTPGWEPELFSSTPQESRSDREYSAEPPVTKESDEVSKETETLVDITTSSINGELKVILNQKHISVSSFL